MKIVSRDRGKLFREAASLGTPQAQQIADRFHLQQNFADALEHFFRHHKQLLKTTAHELAGKCQGQHTFDPFRQLQMNPPIL